MTVKLDSSSTSCSVVDFAGGIVQDYDQVVPTLILEPAMVTAVYMQEHAGQRPPWPSLAMRPAFTSPLHQPGPLQDPFTQL